MVGAGVGNSWAVLKVASNLQPASAMSSLLERLSGKRRSPAQSLQFPLPAAQHWLSVFDVFEVV